MNTNILKCRMIYKKTNMKQRPKKKKVNNKTFCNVNSKKQIQKNSPGKNSKRKVPN